MNFSWDETHWGKFINLYLNRTFFLENNPPFGMVRTTTIRSATPD